MPPGRIGNPWERRNSQESHPTVSDGIVRYCARRARQYKTTLRYLRNLMPREPVFGARDRIFLPAGSLEENGPSLLYRCPLLPPPPAVSSRPLAPLQSRIIAFSARLSRDLADSSPVPLILSRFPRIHCSRVILRIIMRRFNFAISCKGHTFRPKVERAGEQSELLVWILPPPPPPPPPSRARSESGGEIAAIDVDRSIAARRKRVVPRCAIESRGIAGYL